jgi:prophage regulatory protein
MSTSLVAGEAFGMPPISTFDRLLRLSQVKEMIGLGKTTIYQLISMNAFPAPLKPGGSASRWSQNEVLAWLAECASKRVN